MRGNTIQRKAWSQASTPVNYSEELRGAGDDPSRVQRLSLFDLLAFAAQFGLCLNDCLKTEGAECRM
jgi:hypothetical protein